MPTATLLFPPRPSGAALALGYLLAGLLPLALGYGQSVSAAHPWELAGAALGLMALVGMAVQFVTSGRFESASGRLGIDRIMAFHKLAAHWLAVAVVLHPLLYVVPTWMADPALGWMRLQFYLTAPDYRTGVVALAALLVLVGSSILRERLPMRYEGWRAVHVVLALVVVFGGLHHAVAVGRFSAQGPVETLWWVTGALVLAVMATLYGYRWWRLHHRPWRLAGITPLADRMWELDIQPRPGTPQPRYHAGQFVWMTEGNRRFPLFDHPFSIADSPERPGLSLIIKEAGDFTNQIGPLPPGRVIGIDGPYGEFTLESHDAQALLLIGGGVGIAPIIGLVRDMAARGDRRPVRVVYAAGHPQNFARLDELRAAESTLDMRLMPIAEQGAPGWQGEIGLLDRDRLQRLLTGLDPKTTVAMMCGPGPMVVKVSDTLLDLGLPTHNVIYERFDYGGGPTSRQDRARTWKMLAVGGVLAAAAAGFAAVG